MKEVEKIINRIKSGDESAFKQLLEIHHKLIYSIINSFNRNVGDYKLHEDDLFQEGSIALYDAVFSYDSKFKVKFSSYAYNIIRNRILNVARNEFRIYYKEKYSTDNYGFCDRSLHLAVRENKTHLKNNKYNEILDGVMNNLSKQDQMIINMRKNDRSYKEIAEELNITTKRIDNRLSYIRRKCRAVLDMSLEE